MLLLLLACAPQCDGTPEVTDESGAWSADRVASLSDAVDAWFQAVGDDRVCVTDVDVVDRPENAPWVAGATVEIDPDSADPARDAYGELCTMLDAAEALTDQAAEVDPDDGARRFAPTCAQGPPEYGWIEAVDIACGGTDLDPLERFFLETVYPHTPPARSDGDLTATVEDPIVLAGLDAEGHSVRAVVPYGDGLALDTREADTWRVVGVDPNGATSVLGEGADDGATKDLYGGDGVVFVTRGDSVTVHVVETGAEWTITDPDEATTASYARGVVSEGWLYLAWAGEDTRPMIAVDLGTGEVRQIELPSAGLAEEVLVNGIAGVAGGLAIEAIEADVDVDGDMITIAIAAQIDYRWDAASGTFTELTRDLDHFNGVGITGGDRQTGNVWGEAGSLLAAYDTSDDRLLVSDDVCLADVGDPVVASGDRLWLVDLDGSDAVLTGIVLSE